MKSCQRTCPPPRRTGGIRSRTSEHPGKNAGRAAVSSPLKVASTSGQPRTIPIKETLSVHRARLRGKRVGHRITRSSASTRCLASTSTPTSTALWFLPTGRTSTAARTTATATARSSKSRWIPSGTKGLQVNFPLLCKMSTSFAPFQSI